MWGALVDFVSSSGPDLLGFAIEAGATIAAADMQADANRDAARMASEAAQAQALAIQQGNQAAQERFDTVQQQTQPGVDVLRGITVGGTGLTPQQQAEKTDLERLTIRGLDATGLRGSGRSTVAAVRRVGEGFTNDAIARNQQRQDQAAGTLAGANFNAVGDAARLDANTGRAMGDAAGMSGLFDAGATTASGKLRGGTIADLASLTASELKGRRSRYSSKPAKDDDDDEGNDGPRKAFN